METRSHVLTRWSPWILGGMAFLLYVLTGARTIQWQDSAQFTYRIGTGDPGNFYGLAMVHPFHFLLGRMACTLFPSHIPWALSGVSALGGAIAVGLTTACTRWLTRNSKAALFSGISLMLAHTFWRFSGMPEVYTLSAALLMAQVLVYVKTVNKGNTRGWLWIFALNGVAWSNHNLALLTLAVWGIHFLLICRRHTGLIRLLPLMGICWLTGSLPYTLLILQEGMQSGDWIATIHSALFGHGFKDQVTGLFPAFRYTLISIAFLFLSFPNLCPFLTARSLRRLQSVPKPLYAILLIQMLFFLRYNVIDQYTFLIPVFPLIALIAACEFDRVSSVKLRRLAWALLILQPLVYSVTPTVVRATGVLKPFSRNKPFRDDAEYLFWPWRVQDTSALTLATNALEAAGPEGVVVVADPMARHTVKWVQRENDHLQGITLMDPEEYEVFLDAIISRKTVVWAPLRSTDPAPEGWREQNGVWIAENGATPPSTP